MERLLIAISGLVLGGAMALLVSELWRQAARAAVKKRKDDDSQRLERLESKLNCCVKEIAKIEVEAGSAKHVLEKQIETK